MKSRISHKINKPDIKKVLWKPAPMMSPLPVVMVTCQAEDTYPNIITVAWTGIVCSHPPMLSISLMPSRYSFGLIQKTGEFVVNIPSISEAEATDRCGVVSGRDVNKFELTGLTPLPAKSVKPPIIMECPVNIECQVRKTIELGSHVMFISEITGVQISSHLITKDGRLALEKAGLIAYAHGHYYTLGRQLDHFGFSVRKRSRKR